MLLCTSLANSSMFANLARRSAYWCPKGFYWYQTQGHESLNDIDQSSDQIIGSCATDRKSIGRYERDEDIFKEACWPSCNLHRCGLDLPRQLFGYLHSEISNPYSATDSKTRKDRLPTQPTSSPGCETQISMPTLTPCNRKFEPLSKKEDIKRSEQLELM